MVWITKRLKLSKSVFWRNSSIRRLLRAILDIHRMKQTKICCFSFSLFLSAYISFPFWLIIVTDRSDFTLHQWKKSFLFHYMLSSIIFSFSKEASILLKKMDPICKGLHWFCCSLRLMIKFWNHNITEFFPSNQLGAKLLHILQNVICAACLTFSATAVHVWALRVRAKLV